MQCSLNVDFSGFIFRQYCFTIIDCNFSILELIIFFFFWVLITLTFWKVFLSWVCLVSINIFQSFFKYNVHIHTVVCTCSIFGFTVIVCCFQTVPIKGTGKVRTSIFDLLKMDWKKRICVEEWGGIYEHLKLFLAVENEQASLNVISDGCCESLHRGRTVLANINH